MSYLHIFFTNQPTDQLTGVGSRDAYASKNSFFDGSPLLRLAGAVIRNYLLSVEIWVKREAKSKHRKNCENALVEV